MWRTKLFKSRTVRSSAQNTTAVSAVVVPESPGSGVPAASDNSRAASAAVAELMAGLGFVFDALDDGLSFCPLVISSTPSLNSCLGH
jgi:hypothetical protein